jgi:hypothetical protein
MAAGMKLIGVDGRSFTKQAMVEALLAARKSKRSMELLVTWGDQYRTFVVDYHDGPRYPAGERIPGTPDYLSQILHVKPWTSAIGGKR